MKVIYDFSLNIARWLINKFILTIGAGAGIGALKELNKENPLFSSLYGAIKSIFWAPIELVKFVYSALNEGFFVVLGKRIGELSSTFFEISSKFVDPKLNDYAAYIVIASFIFFGLSFLIYFYLEIKRQRSRDYKYFKRKGII